MSDPRVFFAAERTLLAWIRTGLTVIALGFVIGRFGLFLSVLARQSATPLLPSGPTMLANVIGILLVAVGTATLFLAAWQHRSFLHALPESELPAQYRYQVSLFLSFTLGVLGILIVVYLVLTAG